MAGAEATTPTVAAVRPIVIERNRGFRGLGLGELWQYRELLYFFIWRDLKVRYRQTVFGALWAILQPFLLMVVFSVFLGRLNGIAPAGVPYPLFAFSGLVPWTLFSGSLSGSSGSLVGSSNLLQKVYFPRLLLPVAAIGICLIDFALALAVLGGLMVYFGVFPTIQILWVVPLTLLTLVTALAAGVWLAALNVRYRDVRFAVPFLVQVWLFASPVVYSGNLVPEQWRWLYQLNPMAGIIDGFRWALIGGHPPSVESLALSIGVTVLILATGLAYFRRLERTFADVI